MEDLYKPEVEVDAEDQEENKLQNSLFINCFLPYNSALEKEAEELLEEIKINLSHAIQLYELWPGALYWTNRLRSYIKVYGFYFSKEDHVKLIRLLYELITMPKIESPLLHTWCNLLTMLLKKPKTLSPHDLILPWRPLHQVVVEVFKSKFCDLGMKIYTVQTCNALKQVVDHARKYFPLESTKEMLDEWRPLLCPLDVSMIDGMSYLSYFLPTLISPKHHHHGYKLWFEELLKFWVGMHFNTPADKYFIKLFVRLARENIGYIDWTPYLPQLFTRILRSFQLPVGPSELYAILANQPFEARQSASFIVSVLGKGQEYLDKLMLSLESFYHPSNYGRQTRKLLSFLKELSEKFIYRLKNERFKKQKWFNTIPDHAKLTEEDIDAFVSCLLPSLKMAIFSKFGTMDAALTLHNLALVRPELVMPDLLDSTYTALETLTEPHQVIATLQCLTAVSRVLLSGGQGRFPEGKKHLFPLLIHALPGIDSNDFRKTLVSGLLISALITMVPLVDCTASVTNNDFELTEDEKELCLLTGQFEDFILLYFDRCFALVENTSLEQVTALDRQVSSGGKDYHESIMGAGISGSVHTILIQCSPPLFKIALEKLYHFATSRTFESEVAGRMCADMCASASKVNPTDTLKLFIPHCLSEIDKILEDPYQMEAEHPDPALIWNIQLVSQLLHYVGSAMLPYADDLLICLKKCVHLKSKTASKHAASAVNNALYSLTMLYPMETCSMKGGFHRSPQEHLYIRDWSMPVGEDVGIEWHIPSADELRLVDRILVELLQPEIDRLRSFMAGEDMEREKLNQILQLVTDIIKGVAIYLPVWEGPQVEGCPSSVVSLRRKDFITFEQAKGPPEQFSKDKLVLLIHELIEYIMKTCEDDTKSMFALIKISTILLTNGGITRAEVDAKSRSFKYSKTVIGDKLRGRKNEIRPLLIVRVQLQHELRLTERTMSVQTELHHTLLKDLLIMAVSEYAQVRVKAQSALSELLDSYLYSGRKLIPHVLPLLKNDKLISHEQFKGALHVLLIPSMMNVFIHDWASLKEILPVIVKADHSEKPSIQKLMTKLSVDMQDRYEYFTLEYKISDESVAAAAALVQDTMPVSERERGVALNDDLTKKSIENYEGAVIGLVQLINEGKLQWRYSQMAISFLVMLIRHDHPLPTVAIELLTRNLVHDALAVRKMAITGMIYILQQQKRKATKVPVDIAKEAGIDVLSDSLPPGEHKENAWLCYDPAACPRTEEEWTEFKFIDKTHWGYYSYPKTLMTYAPYKDQPNLSRDATELSKSERIVYDAFSSVDFVEKIVSFFSLEESKGHDQFNTCNFTLFKYLFRNFGTTFLSLFQPHIEKLSIDVQHESNQRFACEMICGIVCGSKHWSYPMLQEMRSFVEPLLMKVVDSVTPETIADWSKCMLEMSANRDPRRIYWLLELLMMNPLNGENGSFKDASRLFLLQSLLAQQEWRVAPLLNQLMGYLKTHLTHPYKNVRERIGRVLSQIHLHDMPSIVTVTANPKKTDLIKVVLQKIPTLEQLPSLVNDEDTLKHCKTCLIWLLSSPEYDPEIFQVVSELLLLITVENDDEIGKLVKGLCACVAHTEISVEAIPKALSALEKAIETGLWKVRTIALQVLQVLIFKNLFLWLPYTQSVTDLLVLLCENSQIEVRELAASSISGLVRCGYIDSINKLKVHFIKQSHCRLPKKLKTLPIQGSNPENSYEGALIQRHSGVLGLAALVEACPYSVPEWLPEILDEMALHLHDPAPIQGTVKKTMSEFKRTHHDSWSEHKQKFTDDQLTVLADLLISPSYYA